MSNTRVRKADLRYQLVRRPSTARYQLLVDSLANISETVKDGDDPLDGAIHSLRSVIEFIVSDPDLTLDAPTVALAVLHAALHDVKQGAKPALFSKPNSSSNADRPTNLFREYLRAHLTSALDALIRHGRMRRGDAETQSAGLRTNVQKHSSMTSNRSRLAEQELVDGGTR